MHDAIDWSYQLLDARDQELFRQMSVFAGGFALDGAAAVAGMDESDLIDRLAALVDGSLTPAKEVLTFRSLPELASTPAGWKLVGLVFLQVVFVTMVYGPIFCCMEISSCNRRTANRRR